MLPGMATPLNAPAGLDPAAQAYIGAMTVKPNSARTKLLNDFFKGVKEDGLFGDILALYFLAAHSAEAAVINAREPGTYNGVVSGGGGYAVDRGFVQGNALAISTNFPIASIRTSASVGCWLNFASGDPGTGGNPDYIIMSTNDRWLCQAGAFNGGNKYYANMYGLAGFGPGGGLNASAGLVSMVNIGNAVTTYKGVAAQETVNGTPNTPTATDYAYFCGRPGTGTASSRLGFAYIARGLTQPRLALLNARISTYLTAIGGA